MKTNLLKTAGLVLCMCSLFLLFLIALYAFYTLAGFSGDSFVTRSWEYTFNKPIDQIGVWLILLSSGLILLVLAALSHIAYLIQKLCKLLLEEDYFASASLKLYQKLFISLLILTAGQFCLTSLIALTNLCWTKQLPQSALVRFHPQCSLYLPDLFCLDSGSKGQQLETENSEFI